MTDHFKALEGHVAGLRGVVRSGMLRSITLGGLVQAVRTLAVGDLEPSNIFKILAEILREKPAIVTDAERLTYRDLEQRIQGIAGGLQSRGLARGDKIVLMLHNSPRFVEAYNAAIRAGAAAVTAS